MEQGLVVQDRLAVNFPVCLFSPHKASPGDEFYGSLHCSEVSAFIQIGEAPGKGLSASIDFRLPPAQTNFIAKGDIFGMACSGL